MKFIVMSLVFLAALVGCVGDVYTIPDPMGDAAPDAADANSDSPTDPADASDAADVQTCTPQCSYMGSPILCGPAWNNCGTCGPNNGVCPNGEACGEFTPTDGGKSETKCLCPLNNPNC